MFKRVLKIFGIVFGIALVGLGVLIGVLALQGKFKKPNIPPKDLYIMTGNTVYTDGTALWDGTVLEDGIMNVTYYATGTDILDGTKKSNIYSFMVGANPETVTRLDVNMSVVYGSQLIEFCDKDGNPLNKPEEDLEEASDLQSVKKIGKMIYFKIVDRFDDPSVTGYGNKDQGLVKIEFETNMRNADLTIKIDRQTSDVTLYSISGNPQLNGKFERDVIYKRVSSPERVNFDSYFVFEDGGYRAVNENIDVFLETNEYYIQDVTEDVVSINASETELYPLTAVYAPAHSNNPFGTNAKTTDIFLEINQGEEVVYENIKDSSSDLIVKRDGNYYFKPIQSGEYVFHLVTYPTYKAQQDFEELFDGEENSAIINNNDYSVYNRVIIEVVNTGVDYVEFNNKTATLNIETNLFKGTNLVVKNSSIANGYNLDVTMRKGSSNVTTRYSQIKFLDEDAFERGNVVISRHGSQSSEQRPSININEIGNIVVSNLGDYNGTFTIGESASVDKKGDSFSVIIKNKDEQEILTISFECSNSFFTVDQSKYYYLKLDNVKVKNNDGSDISDLSSNWQLNNNRIVILKEIYQTIESNSDLVYELGTFDVGSYLYVTQGSDSELVNKNFKVSYSGFGADKILNIIPLKTMDNLEMNVLVINEDFSYAYSTKSALIKVNYDEPNIQKVQNIGPLKLSYELTDTDVKFNYSSLDISKIISSVDGTFKYPLLFAKYGEAKVKTIDSIYIKKDNDLYVLVGYEDATGRFCNEVVPLEGKIGSQKLCVVFLNYEYGIESSQELVKSLEKNIKYAIDGLEGIISVGETVDGNIIDEVISEKSGDEIVVSINSSESTIATTNGYEIDVNSDKVIAFNKDYITLELAYAPDKSVDTKDEFGFELSLQKIAEDDTVEPVTESISVKESANGETSKFYLDVTMKNQAYVQKGFLGLITNFDDNGNASGLGFYEDNDDEHNYTLKINAYSYKNNSIGGNVVYSARILRRDYNTDSGIQTEYKVVSENGTDLFKNLFEIVGITYICENTVANEINKECIRIKFNIGKDKTDRFEDYAFRFEFAYGMENAGREVVVSPYIKIESTAVTEYYIKSDDNKYYFSNYGLVYEVDYDNGFNLSPKLFTITGYNSDAIKDSNFDFSTITFGDSNSIGMAAITGLIDETLFDVDYIGAGPEGYDEEEFDYTVSSKNPDIIDVIENGDSYSLKVNGIGKVGIVLKNNTTGVESILVVEVRDTNLKLALQKDDEGQDKTQIDISVNEKWVNELFYYKDTSNNLLDTQVDGGNIVTFEISNLSTGFNAIKEKNGEDETGNWLIKDTQGNIVVNLEYVEDKWLLSRQQDYALSTPSFTLKAKALNGQTAEVEVKFVSPVDIILNPNYIFNAEIGLDYYKGTKLQISSKNDNANETLFKLKNETGNEYVDFVLQYKNGESWTSFKDEGDNNITGETFVFGDGVDLSSFDVGTYKFKIYYNDNKYYEFKVNVKDNIIVEMYSDDDNTENTMYNPLKLTWKDDEIQTIDLSKQLNAWRYKLTYPKDNDDNDIPYYTYSNSDLEQINLTFSAGNSTTEALFEDVFSLDLDKSEISLNKIETTGEKLYPLNLRITDSGNTDNYYIGNFYVLVDSEYEFNWKQPISSIDALKEVEIDQSKFSLNVTGKVIKSIADIKAYSDESLSQELTDEFVWDSENSKIIYNKPVGATIYLLFTFEVGIYGDDTTDTNIVWATPYQLEVNSYRLKLKESGSLNANEEKLFKDLVVIDWDIVGQIEISSEDKNLTIVGTSSGDMSYQINETTDANLTAKSVGLDYSVNVKITLTYTDDSTYTNNLTYEYYQDIEVKNQHKAEIVDYKFNNLTVNTSSLGLQSVEGATWTDSNMNYDIVMTKEDIDLSKRFEVRKIDGNSVVPGLIDNITLVAISSSLNNYKNQILYNSTTGLIEIGDFDAVGYALYLVDITDGYNIIAKCYYLVKISSQSTILSTLNSSLLTNNQRSQIEKEWTYVEGTNLQNVLTTQTICQDFGLDVNIIAISNIIYTAISTEGINGSDSPYESVDFSSYDNLGTNADSKILRSSSNPYSLTVALVVEYAQTQVYIGDYIVTVVPNVEISTSTPTGVEKIEDKGLFNYDMTINYTSKEISFDKIFTNISFGSVEITSIDTSVWGTNLGYNDENAITYNSEEILKFSIGVNIELAISKQVKDDIIFTTKLTTTNDLYIILNVTYKAYVNTNKLSSYTVGYNPTANEFDYSLDLQDLIKNYNGGYDVTVDGTPTLVTDIVTFESSKEELHKTMVVSLPGIVGAPSYTYYVTVKPNIEFIYSAGEDDESRATTDINGQNSQLYLKYETVGHAIYTLSTNIDDIDKPILTIHTVSSDLIGLSLDIGTTYFIGDYSEIETRSFNSSDPLSIQFIPLAESKNAILKISINEVERDVYITIADSYDAIVSYNIDYWTTEVVNGSENSDWKNKYSHQTVTEGSSLEISDLTAVRNECIWELTNNAGTKDKYQLNSQLIKFVDKSDNAINLTSLTGINTLEYDIYYENGENKVLDSNETYATIESGVIKFKELADDVNTVVYLKIFNQTGLEIWYKFIIQPIEISINEIAFNEDLPQGENGEYYSLTLNDLTKVGVGGVIVGTHLATLNFAPTETNFFGIIVDNTPITLNSTLTTGSWKKVGITYTYNINNNELTLTADKTNTDVDNLYHNFNVKFVNMNGIVKEFNLIVTAINTITATTIEQVYANDEGLTLSQNSLATNTKRLTVKNGITEVGYYSSQNTDDTTYYYIQYLGYMAGGVNYDNTNTDLIKGNNLKIDCSEYSLEYMDDRFNIYDVLSEVTITLNFALYYKSDNSYYKVSYINYPMTITNDIIMGINGFVGEGTDKFGDVYLNDYTYNSGYKIDLINKQDGTYYRNAYLTYTKTHNSIYDSDNIQTILDGELSPTVSNYLTFEIKNYGDFNSTTLINNGDGTFTLSDNKAGKFVVIVTANACPDYYMQLTVNVHATITVEQTYDSDSLFAGGQSQNSDDTQIFINAHNKNDEDKSMFRIYKEKTNSDYTVGREYYENKDIANNSDDSLNIVSSIEYVIGSNLSEVKDNDNDNWISTTINELNSDNYHTITLPYVPYSPTQSYYVRYKMTTTDGRVFYCNYLVRNAIPIEIASDFANKQLTTTADCINGTKLYLLGFGGIINDESGNPMKNDGETNLKSLFAYSESLQEFLDDLYVENQVKIKFKNIRDTESNRNDVTFVLKRDERLYEIPELDEHGNIKYDEEGNIIYKAAKENKWVYYIDLDTAMSTTATPTAVDKWFSNSATFDFTIVSADGVDIYTIDGFTLTASDRITPENSKPLNQLFLNSELGDELKYKNFFAVTTTTGSVPTIEETTKVGTENEVKTITRSYTRSDGTIIKNTYDIYSIKLNKSGGGGYYNLQETFYYIVTSDTTFLTLSGDFYIAPKVLDKDRTADYEFDISDYISLFKDFSESAADNLEIASLTGLTVTGISISETTVTVEKSVTISTSFTVSIVYNDEIYREVEVRINIKSN